jgi:DNA polymerase-4
MSHSRKILHVDMDAFYASVEQRDNPGLRGRPIVVGGRPDSRGVVAACSYEARQFGIHSAMPSAQAARLCRDLIFLPPRFSVYREISAGIHDIFRRYTPVIEPLSLDEAYLDVTTNAMAEASGTRVAKSLKADILQQTGLVASAGVSYNKFLAKVASDFDKPDGLCVIPPERAQAFIDELDIKRFYGIGKVTAGRLRGAGIHTGADLRRQSLEQLQVLLGNSAEFFYQLSRGVDERPVSSNRIRKSIGSETTFESNVADLEQMHGELLRLSSEVSQSLQARGLLAGTLTLKARYPDFTTVSRSYTPATALQDAGEIGEIVCALLARTRAREETVRLLGVTASALVAADEIEMRQLELKF